MNTPQVHTQVRQRGWWPGLLCLAATAAILAPGWATAVVRNRLMPSYPTIPPAYSVLSPGQMVGQAKVGFPAYYVDRTRGYRVTGPDGRQFVVDNIEEPRCAFYGTYVNNSGAGFSGSGSGVSVNSSVYIGEVNFDNCR